MRLLLPGLVLPVVLFGCVGEVPPPPAHLLPIQYDVTVKGGGLDLAFWQVGSRQWYSGRDCMAAERVYVTDGDSFVMNFPSADDGVRTVLVGGRRGYDGLMSITGVGRVFGEVVVDARTDDHLVFHLVSEALCVDDVCEPYTEIYEVAVDGPVDPVRYDGYPNEVFVDPATGEVLCHFSPSFL